MLEFESKVSSVSPSYTKPPKIPSSGLTKTSSKRKSSTKETLQRSKSSTVNFNPLTSDWLGKYCPKNITDLKIHHTKLKAIREWLERAQNYNPQRDTPPLLVIYGVSGNGKSTLIELASKEKDFEVISWTEDLWETEIKKFSSDSDWNSKSSQWQDFSSRSKYPSLSLGNTPLLKKSKKILVIEDPLVSFSSSKSSSYTGSNSNSHFNTMYSTLVDIQIPCVLIISDALEKDDEPSIYFKCIPKVLRDSMKIEFLFLPPATENRISKLLEDITLKEGLHSLFPKTRRDKIIEIISSNSLGDIRHSLISYQMACAIELGKQKLKSSQQLTLPITNKPLVSSPSVISLLDDDLEDSDDEALILPNKKRKMLNNTVTDDDEYDSPPSQKQSENSEEDFELPISIRDSMFSNLHIVVKFLHCKLNLEGNLGMDPDQILLDSQTAPDSFMLSLFSHCPTSLESYLTAAWDQGDEDMDVQILDATERADEIFSYCENLLQSKYDPLLQIDRHSGSSSYPDEEALSILSRVLPVCKGFGLEEKIKHKKSLGLKFEFKGLKSSKIFQMNFLRRNNSLNTSLKLSNFHKSLLEIKEKNEFSDELIEEESSFNNSFSFSSYPSSSSSNAYRINQPSSLSYSKNFNSNSNYHSSLSFVPYSSRDYVLDIASMSYYLPQINQLNKSANQYDKREVTPIVSEEEAQIILELPDDVIEEFD